MSARDRQGMSVMLTSRDVPASVRFYRDQCGFTLKESWPSDDAPQWANLVLDGQSIMVGAAMDPAQVESMCGGDAAQAALWKKAAEAFRANAPGCGVQVYVQVEDVDAFAAQLRERGARVTDEPRTQFYGTRELAVDDPTGYRIVFHTPVVMAACQSCAMPLVDAVPGQMYCAYCTDEDGKLRPFEAVLAGTAGYFAQSQKLDPEQADKAAREHLAKQPAWIGH